MPRMSKKLKKELAFFQRKFISAYGRGRRSCNGLCRKCQQSFRAVIIDCPCYRAGRVLIYAAYGTIGTADS